MEPGRVFAFGPFRLEVALGRLLRNGQPIPLTPKGFDVLLALIERRDRLVDKDELMKLVWPDSFVEEANLSQTIFVLRKTLGERPDGQPFIETVPRRGYRFAADVREEASARAAASPSRAARRLLWPATAAVTVLGAFAVWAVLNGGRDTASLSPGVADGATRLVVLPFENLTGQSGDDWLSGAFSDALTFGLQNVGDLVLVHRERIRELYRSEGVREAAALDPRVVKRLPEQMAVRYYVHGSYQRVGNTIKVVSRLVDAVSGEIKAQESLTDRFANVLEVEDELARRFASSFAAGVAPRAAAPPRSLEAYQAVTEARGFYADSQPARAIPLLERAVALDPQYAEAWALLGKAYGRTTAQSTFAASSIDAARDAATKAAERAVALAPEFYEAHVALALASQYFGRLSDWRREARRAIELAPRVAEPYIALADSFHASPNFGCGRDRDATIAIDYFRRAIALDPRNAAAYAGLAYHFNWLERIDEAIHIADEGFSRRPDNPVLRRRQVLKLLFLRRPDEAQTAYPRYVSGREPLDRLLLGSIRVAQNRPAEAAALFDDGIQAAPLSANALWAARIFAHHGNDDLAATYLQRAVSMEPECAAFIVQAPIFKSLQAHPAVRALVTRR
jgi:DNA-binding winged helix-turn-helix (wHTH) protein/TolB-like protein/Tfp pilus assembly protein PilF